MLKVEYDRIKQRINTEHRKALEALDTIWRFVTGESASTTAPPVVEKTPFTRLPHGQITPAIEKIVYAMQGSFVISDVSRQLRSDGFSISATTIQRVLERLAANGNLTRESHPGSNAHHFRVVEKTAQQPEPDVQDVPAA